MITDFHKLDDFYFLFKRTLSETARQQFDQLSQHADLNGMSQSAVAAFQAAWLQVFMDTLNKGYDQFKLKLTEKCLHFLSQANPYVAFVGDKVTVFPENTRFWYRGTNCCVCIVEEKPQVRTLRFNPENWGKESFRLALPYVIFMFIFVWHEESSSWYITKMHMAFRTAPLSDPNDMLCEAVFPDLNGFEVCMGPKWKWPRGTISQQVSECLQYYWHAQFQHEWLENYVRICDVDQRFRNLGIWEILSGENPLWVLDVKFTQVQSLINYIAYLSTQISGLMDTNFANKQIEDAVANSWDDVKAQLLPSTADLKRVYGGHLSVGINTMLESIVSRGVTSLDTAFAKAVLAKRGEQG